MFLGVSRRTFIDYVNRGIMPKARRGQFNFLNVFHAWLHQMAREAARNGDSNLMESHLEALREREKFLRTATAPERKADAQERVALSRELYRAFKEQGLTLQ